MSWEPSFSLGPGSAELTDGRRFLRMLQRNLRYIFGGAGVLIVGALFLGNGGASNVAPMPSPTTFETSSPPIPETQTGPSYAPEVGATYDPSGEAPGATTSPYGDRQLYAISLADLPGLPPDAGPGTSLDVWVTWEPPITRRPKVQLLVADVLLEKVSAPVTVEGPYVANLLVNMKGIPDLLYGDRFGRLNASVHP